MNSYVWHAGDVIHLGAGRSLRLVDACEQGDDEPTVLIVENISE